MNPKNSVNEFIMDARKRVGQRTAKPGERWFFISSEIQDRDGQAVRVTRSFRHNGPSLATLRAGAAEARRAVAPRYADKPRLAAKRWRALQRALRRGRRTQIEQAIGSYTGE